MKRMCFLLALLIVPLFAAPLRAQDNEATDPDTPTAPVVVDGVVLFRVPGVSARPAEVRAAAIADRVHVNAGMKPPWMPRVLQYTVIFDDAIWGPRGQSECPPT